MSRYRPKRRRDQIPHCHLHHTHISSSTPSLVLLLLSVITVATLSLIPLRSLPHRRFCAPGLPIASLWTIPQPESLSSWSPLLPYSSESTMSFLHTLQKLHASYDDVPLDEGNLAPVYAVDTPSVIGWGTLGPIIATCLLALLVIAMRIYTKARLLKKGWRAADWLIIAAMVSLRDSESRNVNCRAGTERNEMDES